MRDAFRHTGLSDRTAEALIADGIHYPDTLLHLGEHLIAHIPGLDREAVNEIKAYRKRFSSG